MGIFDDIKNMQPISNEIITNERMSKILNDIFKDVNREHKLLNTFEQAGATKVYKQVGIGRYQFIGFDLGNDVDKTDTKFITPFGIIDAKIIDVKIITPFDIINDKIK